MRLNLVVGAPELCEDVWRELCLECQVVFLIIYILEVEVLGAVAEVVVKKCPVKMAMVGQQDTFGESGKPDELKAKYGMTAADIVTAAESLR